MKNAIKNNISMLLCLISFCLFFTSSVRAEKKEVLQNRILTGRVLDDLGEPAIGANVLVKGTTIGVAVDLNGNYRIEVPQGKATIVFSYVGYQTQEIPYKGQTTLNITLKSDSEILEDVVVVGYGVQKKVTLTGAVGSIGGSLPIATGSPLTPKTQEPSHWLSCGQTRPQTLGSELSSEITAAAAAKLPSTT